MMSGLSHALNYVANSITMRGSKSTRQVAHASSILQEATATRKLHSSNGNRKKNAKISKERDRSQPVETTGDNCAGHESGPSDVEVISVEKALRRLDSKGFLFFFGGV